MPQHTGFRIADKECHRNYVFISKEQHWRPPPEKLKEEPGKKITGLAGKSPKKGKTKTYLDKPSLWLKTMIPGEQENRTVGTKMFVWYA